MLCAVGVVVHRIQAARGAWPLLPQASLAAISRASRLWWTREADPSLLSFAPSSASLERIEEAAAPRQGLPGSGEIVLLQGENSPLPAWVPDSLLQEHHHIDAQQLEAPALARVLLTRHLARNRELGRSLLAQGIPSLSLPTLEYAGCPQPRLLDQAYEQLDQYFGIILSSPQGARSFDPKNPLPDQLQLVAVGASTATALQERGFSPTLVPQQPHSEGLVAALRAKGWLAKRWLHFRADKGRPLLETSIRNAGGHYHRIVLYLSQRPTLHAPLLEAALCPALEIVSFASGQSYANFKESLREVIAPPQLKALLGRKRLISFGPITSEALRADGLRVDLQLPAPSQAQQLQAIRSLLAC